MSALVDHRTYLSDVLARQVERRRLADPGHEYAAQPALAYASSQPTAGPSNTSKGKTKANVVNYIGAEEAVRNDYAAWYGVSGEYPTNHVLGAGDDEICDE
jgi:mRNA (2'-O-methyladenosine-N6-)-methyltransferase